MPGPDDPDRTDLADLADRVEQLERLIGTAPVRDDSTRSDSAHDPSARDQPAPDTSDTFWLLEALERRVGTSAVAYAGSLVTEDGPVRWQMGHDAGQLLELDWTSLAPALGALGHPARLRILQLVARGEALTAADLAATEGLGSTGQIYHHLRQLVGAGWLRASTRGRHEVPAERLVPLLVVLAAATP